VKIIGLDLETYYDSEYSLRKMTPIEYVLDPRFETIGCAVYANGLSGFMPPAVLQTYLKKLPEKVAVVCHNSLFDQTVLAQRFNYVPALMIDTLGMSRAWWGHLYKSHSLANLATARGLGVKGNTVGQVKGMRLKDIKAAGLYRAYADYSVNDIEITMALYREMMREGFPVAELGVQDMVLRCAIQPKFALDRNMLAIHLNEVQQGKAELLQRTGMENRDDLMSNDKFAEVLRSMGVDPPTKTSLATGKTTYAFAKTDAGFMALEDHEDENVQALVAARMGFKSTLEETRTQRFLNIANLTWPGNEQLLMPVPLKYGAAHTHRLGGDWKLNLQNLRRGTKAKPPRLRQSLTSRLGTVCVKADASQIEARFVAWFCGQQSLVGRFAAGEDVYSSLASKIFGFVVDKSFVPERFIGKTAVLGCLSEGTLVLCERGWVPIEQVALADRVWDGENWVCHQGLLTKGLKETLELFGLWLTPDHRVLCGTQWREAESVVSDGSILSLALVTGAENLPSQDTWLVNAGAFLRSSSSATAGAQSTQLTTITLKTLAAHAAQHVAKMLGNKSSTGNTLKHSPITHIGQGCSTDYLALSLAAIKKQIKRIRTMAQEEFLFVPNGEKIAARFLSMRRHAQAGTYQSLKWTERTTIKVTNPATSSLFLPATTQKIKDKSGQRSWMSMTYDLAFAGPKNRFTVATNAGPVIVHNCGFGVGGEKFAKTIRMDSKKYTGTMIEMDKAEGDRVVNIYRTENPMVPLMWRRLNDAIPQMTRKDCSLQIGPITIEFERVRLPSGLFLNYKDLAYKEHNGEKAWWFTYGGITKKLYGGKFLENIIQALARIATMEAAVRVKHRLYHLAVEHQLDPGLFDLGLQEHDALAYCPPTEFAEQVGDILVQEMVRHPTWAPGVPLACQDGYGVGPNYGDAK
jgi:hypothetical protein